MQIEIIGGDAATQKAVQDKLASKGFAETTGCDPRGCKLGKTDAEKVEDLLKEIQELNYLAIGAPREGMSGKELAATLKYHTETILMHYGKK